MYTSTSEKIECKKLFTWVRRRTGASHPLLPLLCALFYLFAIVSFVTTTPDKFQFQSQVRLSQIIVIVLIPLKFKLCAVFIKWGSRIHFLFMGRQNIDNYWDFPSKISRNWHKRLVPKNTRQDCGEMFVQMSLRDQLTCFADFVGMTLFAVFFLLPLPNCFFRVFPHSFQLSWNSFCL